MLSDTDLPNKGESPKTQGAAESSAGAPPSAGVTPVVGGKQKKFPLLPVAVVAAVLLVGGVVWWYVQTQMNKSVEPRTIKIGLITADAPNADTSTSGGSIKDAVELAQEQIKVEGVTTEIVFKGTGCEKDLVAKAMEDFATQGVLAVIGEECSGATLGGTPVANAKHIPMISPASSSPKLTTEGGDYFFRTIPSDELAADFTAKYIYDQGSRSLAIIYGDEPYGTGLRDGVKSAFEKLGGTVVATEPIADNNPDAAKITGQLNAIKAAKADAIYTVTNFGASNVAIVTKIHDLQIGVPVYAGELYSDSAFITGAGVAAEDLKIVNISQGTTDFIEKAQAAWGKDPEVYAAQAYDAYTAIMKALEKIGRDPFTGPALQQALKSVDFRGASGHIKFDKYGDVAGNYSVFTITGGKLKQTSE